MTNETLQTAREVEEALNVLDNNGVIHEDETAILWNHYLDEVVGMTADEWNEVA